MSTEISILRQQVEKSNWLKTSYNAIKRDTGNPVIIYIVNNKSSKEAIAENYYSIEVQNLPDATEKIKQLGLPMAQEVGAIIVDLPMEIAEVEKFSFFIKETFSCPIICNKYKIPQTSLKFLLQFGFIDFAVDVKQFKIEDVIKKISRVESTKGEKIFGTELRSFVTQGKEKGRDFSLFLKKAFDVTVAALIILTLSPIFILIAIAIRLDSKGPVFYSSPRAGRGYRIFRFYKFRSMVVDADKKIQKLAHLNQYDVSQSGPSFFKLSNDPRVTRVGKFLRNTSLDELPQLFNVLKGDMSLVGNRPLPLYEAATLTTNEYVERFTAPAGMTGFWQIKKRGKAEMSIKERMDLDIEYARKASPLFDLYILANTPAALFQKSDV